MTADELLARLLDVKGKGSSWTARCPAHEDKTPSLSVTDLADRVLLKCHAGCSVEAVVGALELTLADLFLDPPSGNGGKWIQEDADRALSQRGLRRKTIEHFRVVADLKKQAWAFPLGAGRPTKYKAFRAGNGPKYWSEKGATLGCYHIALCVGQPDAWLVEGEPDVWVCWQAGVAAFSLTGGAGNINAAAVNAITAAKIGIVHVVYDRDETGQKGAAKVAVALRAAGQTVAVHQFPGSVGPGGDVTTFYNDLGGDDATFRNAMAALPEAPDAPTGSDQERDEQLTLTDTGNATRLFALHGPHLRYIAPWDRWLLWDGSVWKRDDGAVGVRERAKDVGFAIRREAADVSDRKLAETLFKFGSRSLSASGISAMVSLTRGIPGILLDHERLDTDPYLLGVLNGVVDLGTGSLRPADPADLMTMQAPVRWDPDARAPRWERAMQEWFPDSGVRAYVQRVAGSALVGAQRDHAFVIHYGSGGNGKGTFIRALEHVLGPYAVVLHLSLIEQRRFPEHDTIKADLFRARLAIASETERRIKLAEASIKNLTGGDRIRARRMREDPWSFDPSHSLWLQTNHLPEIAGRDTGIWRRIRVIKWVSTFPPTKEDLDARFRAEGPGILRWLVEGCLDYRRGGLAEPEAVVRETLGYRQAEDTFSRFAAESGLVFREGLEIRASELHDHLATWAEEEGIEPPRTDIGNWLRENGARKGQRRVRGPDGKETKPRFWLGVGIDTNDDKTGQTDALP